MRTHHVGVTDTAPPRRGARLLLVVALLAAPALVGTTGVVVVREHKRMQPRSLVAPGAGASSLVCNVRGDLMTLVANAAGREAPVQILGFPSGEEVVKLVTTNPLDPGAFAMSDDGERVAVPTRTVSGGWRGYAHSLEVFRIRDGQSVGKAGVTSVCGVAFTPDGRGLVHGCSRGAIEWRDAASGKQTRCVFTRFELDRIHRAGPDYIVVVLRAEPGAERGELELRSLATGDMLNPSLGIANGDLVVTHPSHPLLVTLTPDQRTAVVRSLPSGATLRTLTVKHRAIAAVALSREADLAAVLAADANENTFVDLFSLDTGELLHTWEFGQNGAHSVTLVPGAETVAVATNGRIELRPFRR